MSSEWMKHFNRSSSEKLRPSSTGPALTSTSECSTRSIKQSDRTGFESTSLNVEASKGLYRETGVNTLSMCHGQLNHSKSYSTEPRDIGYTARCKSQQKWSQQGLQYKEQDCISSSAPSTTSSTSLTSLIFRRNVLRAECPVGSISPEASASHSRCTSLNNEQQVPTQVKRTTRDFFNLKSSLLNYSKSSAFNKISSSITSFTKSSKSSSSLEMKNSKTGVTKTTPTETAKSDENVSSSVSHVSNVLTEMKTCKTTATSPLPSSSTTTTPSAMASGSPATVVVIGARAQAGWTRALNGSCKRSRDKKTKTSIRLLDSSSDEEEDEKADEIKDLPRQRSTSTDDGSTPSPRTPSSFKILSGIDKNQATAFEYPPTPFSSRPSSYDRSVHQSSDEFSTSLSSFRSRSTSSEVFEENCLVVNPSAPSVRSVPTSRINDRPFAPLRKQEAIAEEVVNLFLSYDQNIPQACKGSLSSYSSGQSHVSSIGDSCLVDCADNLPVTSTNCSSACSTVAASSTCQVCMKTCLSQNTSLSLSDSQTCHDSSDTRIMSSSASISLSEEPSDDANPLFRRVTIRKRLTPIAPSSAMSRPLSVEPCNPYELTRPSSEPTKPSLFRPK